MACNCQTAIPYKLPVNLGEIEHRYHELADYQDYLPSPETKPEAIFDALWSTAKEIWPDDTQKAEDWVRQQALRYGIAEAQSKAAEVSQSPITWIIVGLGLAWLVNRR